MATLPHPFNRQAGAAAVMGAINANPLNLNTPNQGNVPFVPQDGQAYTQQPTQQFVPPTGQPMGATSVPQSTERGGVTGDTVDYIRALFLQRGYIVGYIARNGPQTTIAATTSTNKNSSTRIKSLTVKQTKPSSPEAILMGIPKGCILRDSGQLARPNEVNNGEVAGDKYEVDDLVHFAIPRDTACRYLSALGSEATEYQPTHTGMEHDPEKYEKYYKTYISAINKPRATSKKSSTSFTLRTEDPTRRSFYTPMNVFFLRVAAHRKFNGIKSVEDEYLWNTHTLAYLGNARSGRNSTGSTLNQLYQDAQSQIFRKSYTINGETKDNAIGSAFFIPENSMTIGEGDAERVIVKQALNVIPWHAPRKDSTTKPVESLVWRIEVWNKEGTTSAYRPKQLTYLDYQDGFSKVNAEIKNKEDKIDVAANRALFASNDAFMDKVSKLGFDLEADILKFATRKVSKVSKRVSSEEVTKELNSSSSRDAVSADYQSLMARAIQLTHRK